MTWTVQRLDYARLDPVQPAPVGWTPEGGTFSLPVFGYLLRRGSTAVLFDLAPSGLEKAGSDGHHALASEPLLPAEAVLRAGCDPRQVTMVVLSHLHWDHAYGIEGLPNAQVVIQEDELQAAQAPAAGTQGSVYDTLPWLRDEERRIKVLTRAATLAPGLTVLPTPGHTPGSQTLLARAAAGTVALAGDLAHRYENILGLAEDGRPTPPGLCSSPRSWLKSLTALSHLGCIPLLAHDERGAHLLATRSRLVSHGEGFALESATGERFTVARDLRPAPVPSGRTEQ